eukprot:CAMPEP_0198339362 /NCGR_PEP_ID=MMETSP1450-20131203/39481_1 /TAXON_ID=753684 ORGANISM="Madagascaria erythrocladiodes, Strain CCMP3234" /NCGR_SAMPLE_ID=MMETSP1450 /ASSEMBLY_ACC=CAM_ASM_001115 /LENGTH=143 /DNA_ID=CAMNT_0044044289 /DNA_START=136 /DNA_END=563 /DNA_ORIENTATION=+
MSTIGTDDDGGVRIERRLSATGRVLPPRAVRRASRRSSMANVAYQTLRHVSWPILFVCLCEVMFWFAPVVEAAVHVDNAADMSARADYYPNTIDIFAEAVGNVDASAAGLGAAGGSLTDAGMHARILRELRAPKSNGADGARG